MLLRNYVNNKLDQEYFFHCQPAKKSQRGRPSGGFLFGWKKHLNLSICESNQNYILLLDTNENLFIFFVYVSPDNNYAGVLSELFTRINSISTAGKKVMVMGDLNGRIGDWCTQELPRKPADSKTNKNGKILFDHIIDSGLLIANGNISGDLDGAMTFLSDSVCGQSVVDLLLYSNSLAPLVQKFQVIHQEHSDHFPIYLSLQPKNTKPCTKKLTSCCKKKIRFPREPEQQHELKLILDSRLEEIDMSSDIDSIGSALENAVVQTCSGLNMIQLPKPITSRPRWFDLDCQQLKTKMKRCLRDFRENYVPDLTNYLQETYRVAKRNYETTIRNKSENFKHEMQLKLMDHKNSASFWSAFKSISLSQHQSPNTIPKPSWFQHFSNVFSVPNFVTPEPIEILSNYEPDPILDEEINVFEIKLALKKLKANKASGKDLVPNEIWKLGSPSMVITLCSIFQLCFSIGRVPQAR